MTDRTKQTKTHEWLGTTYRTILTPEASGGAMSIVDSVSPPGSGPPRHVHHAEDEVFVQLSGEIEWWMRAADGTERTGTVGPGQTLFIPRGREHTFRALGDQPARHLVILTPGGFEGFFAAMAEARCRIPEDMDRVVADGRRFNMDFTGPPLGTA